MPSHNYVRCYLQQGGGVNRASQEISSSPEGSFTRTNNSSKQQAAFCTPQAPAGGGHVLDCKM